ncbi:MAG TPA: PAS domain-containing protein [Vicinamibacterales bacterium]|nr:PAS domain-containing protein [Vicinamibacterales bacterium]
MSTNSGASDPDVAADRISDPQELRSILEAMAPGEAEWTLAHLASALFPSGIGTFDQVTWPSDRPRASAKPQPDSAEDKLRTAELRYRTLIEQIPAVTFMAVLGEGDNEIYVSPHIEALLGFTQDEWLENPFLWYTQLHPDDREIWHAEFARGCRTGGPFRAECRFLARDGHTVWVRGEARLVKDDVGRPLFLQGVAFDISESKKAEAALLQQAVATTEERYRDLVEQTGAIFWEADVDKPGFTFVSRGAEQILGFPREQWLSDPEFWLNRIHPDDRATVEAAARRQGHEASEIEFRAIAADGRTVWLHQKMSVDPSGVRGPRRLGAIFDITDRKRAEEILRANEVRLRTETDIRHTLHRIGSALASELDIEKVVQLATDEATTLTGAEFGAFFYNVIDERGEAYTLFTLSGASRDAFANFPMPRKTKIFGPTFGGEGTVRLADVTADPRFGRNPPYHGMPKGHLPVRSYLAVPVVSRAGSVLGGMFFGHSAIGRFSEDHERLAAGIAGWTAVALDNAQLFTSAEKAREAAEAANREKDLFLATMSHELRTPLNAVVGWTAILRSNAVDEATRARGLETIERNARAQARIIEDLLDVSRIVAGKLPLDRAPVDVRAVVESALDSIRLAAEAKQMSVRRNVVESPVVVIGDAARLHQAVGNLLTNAIKFTPRGGVIDVHVDSRDGNAIIIVRDNGEGISRELLPHVFERFRQGDQSATRSHGGLGLGLSIVRHLIDLHGGSVRAESPGVGLGATFTIELPLLQGAAPAVDGPAVPPPRNLHRLDGLRVLVAEDDVDARDLVVHLLEQAGASVFAAATASEALDLLDAAHPDVLVSDIGMPDQDGYSLLREIRRRGGPVGRVPALAVTAYAGAQDHERALAAGFQAHLGKPIVPHQLIDTVHRLAKRA